MLTRCALVLALLACFGCKREPQRVSPAPSSSGSSDAASPVSDPSKGGETLQASEAGTESVVSRGFDSVVAHRFVERWLTAQNEHDFAAYSELYAARFSGTKRVGAHSQRFDRAGWLRDRRAMFRDGVAVRASELQFSGSAGAVRVVFTQDFVAPGFHDSGKKELFLVAEPSGFAISREEMLASRLAEPVPAADQTVLAYHRDGVVLSYGFGEGATAKPRLLARGAYDPYDVSSAVDPRALSRETRAWLGRKVTVYAKGGLTCEGVVSHFELRVSAEPHFGMRQAWAGEGGLPKAPLAQVAQEIWGIARDEERFVIGVLDHECQGDWAVTRSVPFTPAVDPAPALRARALSAFKGLPAYRELQARFAQDAAIPEQPWETVDGALTVVQLSTAVDSSLVVVAARGGAGCAGFGGNLSAIWKLSGSGPTPQFSLRGVFKDSTEPLQVNGAVDQNADGTPELLAGPDGGGEISVLRLAPFGYERTVLFATSFWDCGC